MGERCCERCDNYDPNSTDPCAVTGCDPETLSKFCDDGVRQLEAENGRSFKESPQAAEVPGQSGKSAGSEQEQGTSQGTILYAPRKGSPPAKEVVCEEPEAAEDNVKVTEPIKYNWGTQFESVPAIETIETPQRCMAKTKNGLGPQCKRDALEGKKHCGSKAHKEQVLKMLEENTI